MRHRVGLWLTLACGLLTAVPSATPHGDGLPGCNPTTGLDAPLPVCTPEFPCTNVARELGQSVLTTSSERPVCRTSSNAQQAGRLPFDDGEPLEWTDPAGVPRYACLFWPPGASPASPRPLVVFLHGGGAGTASTVYDFTSLRAKAESYDLSGDPARSGFVLLSIQGRNLHYPTFNPRDGHHHDFYYRDLASPSTNPDLANLDRLIDSLATSGGVDTSRVYLMGWSNGGFFSQMTAIARHDRATPGGHHVAAAAVFTAADPFNNTHEEQSPSCRLDPYPTSNVPIFIVSRACDVVACDQAQANGLRQQGFVTEPGHVVEPWVVDLASRVGDRNVRWQIVAGSGWPVTGCTAPGVCTPTIATLNHLRWPDGVADGSGIDHERTMLDFLRDHPLPAGEPPPRVRRHLRVAAHR